MMVKCSIRRGAALLLVVASLLLSGCQPLVEPEPQHIDVFASFYPIFSLVDGILKDVPDVSLRCLVQPQDGCLRDYRLSDWDLYWLAAEADAVFIGGRGLENFESTLFAWGDSGPAVMALQYNLPLYSRQQTTHASDAESHLDGVNPHLYMSIDGAKRLLESVSAAMQTLDPAYAEQYTANLSESTAKLDALFAETSAMLSGCAGEPVILMNEALIYVANDYQLEVVDWVDRESGAAYYEQELQSCLERLSQSGAKVVLIERQAPQRFVEALENAGYRVARIDIFSTHGEDNGGFADYIETQRNNAAAIKAAFDGI